MTDILLNHLNNSDLYWFNTIGIKQSLPSNTVLLKEDQNSDYIYLILEGIVSVMLPQSDNSVLSRAYAAIEEEDTQFKEITQLSSGEILGDIPLMNRHPRLTRIKTISPSNVLAIPRQSLEMKLKEDGEFASRFYSAIAVILANRLRHLLTQLGRHKLFHKEPIKDVLCLFSELHDSDLDWLMTKGNQQFVKANTILIQEDIPIDGLYIVLEGSLSLGISEDQRNPLTRAFAAIEGNEIPVREIATISKGEMVGESPFIDTRLPAMTVKAIQDSKVLMIPRQLLMTQLQQDLGFASRFYRVLSILLSSRFQELLSRMGTSRRVYHQGRSLSEEIKYDDELDLETLDKVALAGAKFEFLMRGLEAS